MKNIPWASGLILLSSLAVACALAADSGSGTLAEHVRAANGRFKDVNVAIAEGYAPIPCASGVEGGAVGVHYVNGEYLKDEAPDLKRPQAVMYEPLPSFFLVGRLSADDGVQHPPARNRLVPFHRPRGRTVS